MKQFTKYPNSYIKASDEVRYVSSFTFDFIVMYNYSDDLYRIVKSIVNSVFEKNDCRVVGYDIREVDYSNSPEYREFDVVQAGIDFSYTNDYDGEAIEQQMRVAMKDAGYQIIGNPEFYSDVY